jgi:hypothetical protein
MGKVSFEVRDFFEMEVPEEQRFDVVYDYTSVADLRAVVPLDSDAFARFFVAIPPQTRPAWGAKMCQLVKPGGYLITLIYPIEDPKLEGPPFMVRSPVIRSHRCLVLTLPALAGPPGPLLGASRPRMGAGLRQRARLQHAASQGQGTDGGVEEALKIHIDEVTPWLGLCVSYTLTMQVQMCSPMYSRAYRCLSRHHSVIFASRQRQSLPAFGRLSVPPFPLY